MNFSSNFTQQTQYDNKFSEVEFLGFHALTTVGVTNNYFIVRNSRGNKWGIDQLIVFQNVKKF